MSFSVDVKKELISAPVKQTCCKKALLFGLLYNSTHIKDTHFTCEFGISEAVETAQHLLGNQGESSIDSFVRGGRTVYTLAYSSKAFAAFTGISIALWASEIWYTRIFFSGTGAKAKRYATGSFVSVK